MLSTLGFSPASASADATELDPAEEKEADEAEEKEDCNEDPVDPPPPRSSPTLFPTLPLPKTVPMSGEAEEEDRF